MTISCNEHASSCYLDPIRAHLRDHFALFNQPAPPRREKLQDWFVPGTPGLPLSPGDLILWRPPLSVKNHVAVATGWGDWVSQSGFVLANPADVHKVLTAFNLNQQARQAGALPAVQRQAQQASAALANIKHSENFAKLSDLSGPYGKHELWKLKSRAMLDSRGPLAMFLSLSSPGMQPFLR